MSMWSDLSPTEQVARLDQKIADAEAAGRRQTARGLKAHKLAILSQHSDANGRIRLPHGDGRVARTAGQLAGDDRRQREASARREAAREAAESEGRGEAPPARRADPGGAFGARAGRVRTDRRPGDLALLNDPSRPSMERYEAAKRHNRVA